jgi:MFS superfamily sulfate permease-like transporter
VARIARPAQSSRRRGRVRRSTPRLPDFSLVSFSLVTGALAVAAIVFVQGAGVAEAAPNPDGQPQPDTDIVAQGAGNLVSGFFRGLPMGGSVGQTALNVRAGGRTRWAAIWSGAWMLVILAAVSPLVAKVAVPPWPRCSSSPPPARCGPARSPPSCAPGGSRRSR